MPIVIDKLGSSTRMGGSGRRLFGVGEGLTDGHRVETGYAHDLARPGGVDVDLVEAFGGIELGDLPALDRAVEATEGNDVAPAQHAVVDPADGQATDIGRCTEVGHQHLKRMIRVVRRRRYVPDDGVEQRPKVAGGGIRLCGSPTLTGAGIEHGKGDLLLVGIEIQEELLHLVDHLCHSGVGPVHLVDHYDHRQPGLERLA